MPSNHFKIGMSNKAAAFYDGILFFFFWNYRCNKQRLVTDLVRGNFLLLGFEGGLMNTQCFPATLWMAMLTCLSVGRPTALVQTEIRQQLLDGLVWNLAQICMIPKGSIPKPFVISQHLLSRLPLNLVHPFRMGCNHFGDPLKGNSTILRIAVCLKALRSTSAYIKKVLSLLRELHKIS